MKKSLFFYLSVLITLVGCQKQTFQKEEDNPSYISAFTFLKQGKNDHALSEFLKVIDQNRKVSKSYLEAGKIYLNDYDDPIMATYFFKQFLLHSSKQQDEKIAKELIETAKKRFLQKCIGQNQELSNDHKNFLSLLKNLREENMALKKQLLQFSTHTPTFTPTRNVTMSSDSVTRAPQGKTPQKYTVTNGDSLSGISQKMYGTPGQWQKIFEANRDMLKTPNSLSVGQTLRIP